MFPWSVAATCVAIVSLLTDEFQHRHRNTGGLGLRMGDMYEFVGGCERGNQQPSSEIKLCRNRCRCEGRLKRTIDANRMSIIIKTFALGRESGCELAEP